MSYSEKTTCMAVARVWVHGLTTPLSSYEEIPVKPDPLSSQTVCRPGETIIWNNDDGTIRREREYDTTIWWKKPTLSDALTNTRKGEFWQFFSSGAVLVKDTDGLWFWSEEYVADTLTSPVVCEVHGADTLRHREEDSDTSDHDSCGCHNSYRCCRYDPMDTCN